MGSIGTIEHKRIRAKTKYAVGNASMGPNGTKETQAEPREIKLGEKTNKHGI